MGIEARVDPTRVVARGCATLLGLLVAWSLIPLHANAFEFFDGKIQVHGFYEMQIRSLSADYSDDWDLAQWYHVLNIETEMDVLEEVGPFNLVQAFLRAEVRFDCIYSLGCSMFPSVNTYGDRADRLPERLSNSTDVDGAGTFPVYTDGKIDFTDKPRRPHGIFELAGLRTLQEQSKGADAFSGRPEESADCIARYGANACSYIAGGANSPVTTLDDPLPPLFDRFADWRFTQTRERGGSNYGRAILPMGPWLPKNHIEPIALFADIANPLDNSKTTPQLVANTYNGELIANGYNAYIKGPPQRAVGFIPQSRIDTNVATAVGRIVGVTYDGARPFRPIPVAEEGASGVGDEVARGLYLPAAPLRKLIRSNDLTDLPFNYSESDRAWNRGQSQQQTKELKEFYFDIEMMDGDLWLRLGRQAIVWGKTELFSPTDQFNPQDLALSNLPSLEETRIPLWSLRSTYSFYEVGELSDVRLEMGLIFDAFQPADLGACGEPFTPDPVCAASFGSVFHGITGLGVAGFEYPEQPWDSLSGLQGGARLEFRWGRYTFAISDFYGFDDFPHPHRFATFERNVDPNTGLPRIMDARGPCNTADRSNPACLQPGPTDRSGADSNAALAFTPNNALDFHHSNQTIFAFACATTVGIARGNAPSACGLNAFNAQSPPRGNSFTVAQIVGATLAGSISSSSVGLFAVADELELDTNTFNLNAILGHYTPVVTLSRDPMDLSNHLITGTDSGCTDRLYYDNPLISTGTINTERLLQGIPTCGGDGHTLFDLQPGFNPPGGPGELSLSETLTPEQEALLGCGPFYGVNCDVSGIDLLNAEGSVFVQSWPGIEGTYEGWRTDDATVAQPGTIGFFGPPRCTTGHIGGPQDPAVMLPGCRGPGDIGYDINVDGDPTGLVTAFDLTSLGMQNAGVSGHPFTGQAWQNELAAFSWNFLVLVVNGSDNFNPAEAYTAGVCSFITPQFCNSVQGIFSLIAVKRNDVRAGGSRDFGRRDFIWHSGGAITLNYEKRNALGFAMDFAEDTTKSNWGIEFTWLNGVPVIDNNSRSNISKVDEFNLTVSVDRPTFINFLSPNRAFFINSQWFFQYRTGYNSGWWNNGPWNVLGTLTIVGGYFQDRLFPIWTLVYDVGSGSGASLMTVRFSINANFSMTFGSSMFFGRQQLVDVPVNEIRPGANRAGSHPYKDAVSNGLAVIRDRDEFFARIRYTF